MKRFLHTINGKICILLIAMSFFTIISLIVAQKNEEKNYYARLNDTIQTNLDLYTQNIDTSIGLMDQTLIYMPVSNDGMKTLFLAESGSDISNLDYWSAVTSIINGITAIKYNYPYIENIFVYYPNLDFFLNAKTNAEMTDVCMEKIGEMTGVKDGTGSSWNYAETSSGAYLYEIYYLRRAYIGVWIPVKSLSSEFGISYLEDGEQELPVNVLSSDGIWISGEECGNAAGEEVYEAYDTASRSLYIQSDIDELNVALVCRVEHAGMASTGGSVFGSYIIWIFILDIMILVITSLGIWYWVHKPLLYFQKEMDLIRKDSAHRIGKYNAASREFEDIFEDFNETLDQLDRVKIQVYEQELDEQETKLRYLGQQIQPHFMLNALNTIYNYVHQDPERSREIIRLLSSYYRYVVNVQTEYVTLNDELVHIENYLRFQKLRLEERLEYEIDCEDALKVVPIPPFLLEGFVGNSLKYGTDEMDRIRIRIQIRQPQPFCVQILIRDHGEGFPDETLDAIDLFMNGGDALEELGIGIRNSIDRVRLIYKGMAHFSFYNDGGAVVELTINLQKNV